MMITTSRVAVLSALLLTTVAVGIAGAQSSAKGRGNSTAPSPSPAPQEASQLRPGAPEENNQTEVRAPVLRVISVEVMRSTQGSTFDIIRVRGLASTDGWEEAELVPLTRGVPKDGILQLVLVARAPSEAMEAKGFEPIEAVLPMDSDHPFKGVNVHSASESVTLTEIPGYAESKGGGEDCSKCVGKIFVPKGGSMPAGKSAADVMKEEQLPPLTRVIKHSDGIPSAESNPNRLTLVLSRDGTIAGAIWD
ncbi:MAG TPA: hypothetical protein VGD54_00255 [Steroidobacteraceae bacterium]